MSRAGYVRVANDIGGSEEALALGEDTFLSAIGLFVLSLGYCDRQLTDGEIPRAAMSRAIAPGVPFADALVELERVGLLERTADGWTVPGYLKWQRSRAQVEAAAVAGSKGAAARWGNADRNANRNADRNANRNADRNANRNAGSECLREVREVREERTLRALRALAETDVPAGAQTSVLDDPDDAFEEWWAEYGRIGSKADAERLYRFWRGKGAERADLLTAARVYRDHCAATDCKMQHARTFLAKPAKGARARWYEWADGEAHGSMDVRDDTTLHDVLSAGAEAFGLKGGNGNGNGAGTLERGGPARAAVGGPDARRGVATRELEAGL